MTLRMDNGIDFSQLHIAAEKAGGDALAKALEETVLPLSTERVPKLSGDLASFGKVKLLSNGTAEISYHGPYARKQHELFYKHPQGGQAKYLESAINDAGHDALDRVAAAIRDAL